MRISTAEFVAIMAMLVATVAISIDGLLPALSIIAKELTPLRPNNAQIILSSFVAGMAIGTLIVGPLSDSYGRKPIIYGGAFIYILTSVVCYVSQSLELILVARFLQGVGASAPRVVAQALVRDFYKGREMARISSFIMIVFALVPAVAPLLGSFVMFAFDWRAIFFMFIAFVAISTIWMGLRINETISEENRVKFNLRNLIAAFREVLSHPLILSAVITLVFAYSILFVGIFLIQPVFEWVFGRPESFPYWFAAIALLAASSSYVNARLVRRLGMRMLTNIAFRTQVGLSTIILLVFGLGYFDGEFGFFCFLFWMFSIFFQAGLTMGNLTALAMEPVGHIAGTAASLISAIATIGSVFLAAIVGQFFDGTPIAMIVGITLFASFGAVSAHRLKRYERGSEL
ncbi:multidrug effflux MFS transporter [Paracoccaceae bacterium]|nr:multidrug effflux MFS transporter [Paracoccaceae bacterium]